MVKLNPEVRETELEALIRQQARDARSNHVRRGGPVTGIDLDRLADTRPGALVLIEGRAHEWGIPTFAVCPTCHGRAGSDICLRCNGGGEGRTLRGKETPCPGGPTSYSGASGGLKGGKGR